MEAQNGVVSDSGPPPPSPLTGCYLLIVIGEPHSQEHKDIILRRVAKGLLSWDVSDCMVDLEKDLAIITEQALEGEEARFGERLIQYASENLVTEILIHPAVSTLSQCVRNLLSSFTRHRHIIHSGYTFAANGSWALQDGTFSLADFAEAFQEPDVQRVIRAYENGISVDIHCAPEGDWPRLPKEAFAKNCKVRLNPVDVLPSSSPAIADFLNYITPYLVPLDIMTALESSEIVGNIRFSHPTLYVFPGGQGDAALFGINGFNMLLDGGFSRKACFWDFVRHLDRLDAVLLTRLNNCNVSGITSVLKRKRQNAVYPQIGHFFSNIQERKALLSPDGDKDRDPLLINLLDEGHDIVTNLKHLSLHPQTCYRDSDPINLYHKVGHGTLDMYVLSPNKDAREVREFVQKWNSNDARLFANPRSKEFAFPLPNLVSICALLVWQPSNASQNITRILFPGSTPQSKIFEGLDRLKQLDCIKYPVCSDLSLNPPKKSKERIFDAPAQKILPDLKKEKSPRLNDAKAKDASKDSSPKPADNKTSETAETKKEIKKSDSTESNKSGVKAINKPAEPKTSNRENKEVKDSVKDTIGAIKSQKVRDKDVKPMERKSAAAPVAKIDKKPSPTTPKKSLPNGDALKPKLKISPSATPAKSAKEATNRKVLESKKQVPKKDVKAVDKKDGKEADKKSERKPISRRPKPTAAPPPAAAKPATGSPIRKKPDSIAKKAKLDKEGTTDSSTVSTPTTDGDVRRDLSKMTPEELEQLKAQELADLQEEQEVVQEIEAVFRKGEGLDESEGEMRKIKSISIEEKTDEEYLVVEKVIVQEDEIQKLTRDSEESEKQRKLSEPKVEEVVKEIISPEEKVDKVESGTQPDEKFSATVESGATTAPTLPEDERIPLDDIKEKDDTQIIEEKHVKEETKEKEPIPVIQLPSKSIETPPMKMPPVVGIRIDKQQHVRDIVKTPDEVADLPVHEVADHYVEYQKPADEVVRDVVDLKADVEKSEQQVKDDAKAVVESIIDESQDVIEKTKEAVLATKHVAEDTICPEALKTDIKDASKEDVEDNKHTLGTVEQVTLDSTQIVDDISNDVEKPVKQTDEDKITVEHKAVLEGEVLKKADITVTEFEPLADSTKVDQEITEEKVKEIQEVDDVKDTPANIQSEIIDVEKIEEEIIESSKEIPSIEDKTKDLHQEIEESEDIKEIAEKVGKTIDTTEDKQADIYDTKEMAKGKMEKVKETISDKIEDSKQIVKESTELIGEKTEEVSKSTKEQLEDVKERISEKIDEQKEIAEETNAICQEKVEGILEVAKDKAEKLEESVMEKIETAKEFTEASKEIVLEKIKDIVDISKDEIEEVKSSAVKSFADGKEMIEDKVEQVSETAKKQIDDVTDTLTDKIDDAKEFIEASKDSVADKVKEVSDTAEVQMKGVKDVISEKVSDAKEILQDTEDKIEEQIEEVSANAKEQFDEVKDAVGEKIIDATEKIQETKEDVAEKVKDISDKIEVQIKENVGEQIKEVSEITKEQISEVKDALADKIDDAKETIAEKVKDISDKTAADIKGLKDGINEKILDAKDAVKEIFKTDKIPEQVKDVSDTSKEHIKDITQSALEELQESKAILSEQLKQTSESVSGEIDEIATEISSVKESIAETKEEVKSDIKEKLELAATELDDAERKVEEKIDGTKDEIASHLTEIARLTEIQDLKDEVDDKTSKLADNIAKDMPAGFDEAKKTADSSIKEIATSFDKSLQEIKTTAKDGVQTSVAQIKETIDDNVASISENTKQLEESLIQSAGDIKDTASELISDAKTEVEKAADAISDTKQSVTGALGKSIGILGDVAKEIGDKLATTIATEKEKVDEMVEEVERTEKEKIDEVVDTSIVIDSTERGEVESEVDNLKESPDSPCPTPFEYIAKAELGRKSPKEREEDVAKIVASVAEVLKSEAPLEDFKGKIPLEITTFPTFTPYTTELRETHITTVDSPVSEMPGQITPIKEEKMDEVLKEMQDDDTDADSNKNKISELIKSSNDLLEASSKMISGIKERKEEELQNIEEEKEDVGTAAVHRMLVTASSEDGGEETVICPPGSIKFPKSSESSERSSPDLRKDERKQETPSSPSSQDAPSVLHHEPEISAKMLSEDIPEKKDKVDDDVKKPVAEAVTPIDNKELEATQEQEKLSHADVPKEVSGKSTPEIVATLEKSGKSTPDVDIAKDKSGKSTPDSQESNKPIRKDEQPVNLKGNVTETKIEKTSDKSSSGKSSPETGSQVSAVKPEKPKSDTDVCNNDEALIDSGKASPETGILTSSLVEERKESLTSTVTALSQAPLSGKSTPVSSPVICCRRDDKSSPDHQSPDVLVDGIGSGKSSPEINNISGKSTPGLSGKSSPEIPTSPGVSSKDEKRDSLHIEKSPIGSGKMTPETSKVPSGKSTPDLGKGDSIKLDTDSLASGKVTPEANLELRGSPATGRSAQIDTDSLASGKGTPELKQDSLSDKITSDFDKQSTQIETDSLASGNLTPDLGKCDLPSGKSTPEVCKRHSLILEDKLIRTTEEKIDEPDLKETSIPDEITVRKSSIQETVTGKSLPSGKTDELHIGEKIPSGKSTPDSHKSSEHADADLIQDKAERKIETDISIDRKDSIKLEDSKSGKTTPEKVPEQEQRRESIQVLDEKIAPAISHEQDENLPLGKTSPDPLTKKSDTLSGKSSPAAVENISTSRKSSIGGDQKQSRKSTPDIGKDEKSGKSSPEALKPSSLSGKSTPLSQQNGLSRESISSGKSTPGLSGKITPEPDISSGKATPDLKDSKGNSEKSSEKVIHEGPELSKKSSTPVEHVLSGKSTPESGKVSHSGKSTPDFAKRSSIQAERILSGKSTPELDKPSAPQSGKATPEVISKRSSVQYSGQTTPKSIETTSSVPTSFDVSQLQSAQVFRELIEEKITSSLEEKKTANGDLNHAETTVKQIASEKSSPEQAKDSRKSSVLSDSDYRKFSITSENTKSLSVMSGKSSPDAKEEPDKQQSVQAFIDAERYSEQSQSPARAIVPPSGFQVPDPMSTSFYGALPDDGAEGEGKEEVEVEDNGVNRDDVMSASFIGQLPSDEKAEETVKSWGKPLGLPSPAPLNDNKGTPKKERRLPTNVSLKNKLNQRSESPSKKKKLSPVYVDLSYVPHHGNSYYSQVDFFKRVRARYYVFSGIEPSKEVYNALLEAKQTWEDKDLEVTIIPTYDTDVLGYWVAENEELLTKYKIDLSPSASRCTINLQDHETSCSAYRLEF